MHCNYNEDFEHYESNKTTSILHFGDCILGFFIAACILGILHKATHVVLEMDALLFHNTILITS